MTNIENIMFEKYKNKDTYEIVNINDINEFYDKKFKHIKYYCKDISKYKFFVTYFKFLYQKNDEYSENNEYSENEENNNDGENNHSKYYNITDDYDESVETITSQLASTLFNYVYKDVLQSKDIHNELLSLSVWNNLEDILEILKYWNNLS